MGSTKTDFKTDELRLTPELQKEMFTAVSTLYGKKVMVVGDIGLDEYVLGQVRRISPEAPVPVLEVEEEDSRLGLSGNVAQNVVSLGGEVVLVSVIGQDLGAVNLKELLKRNQVSSDFLITDFERPTTRKTRIMAKHHHLVRVDYEVRKYLKKEIEDQILNCVREQVAKVDVVVLQDYAKGVISRRMVEEVCSISKAQGKLVLMDPHRSNDAAFYAGVDILKPNFDEALELAGIAYEELRLKEKSILDIGQILIEQSRAPKVVITRGRDGMSIFSEGRLTQAPTYARQVFDVTGAGDTVIAAMALGIAAGLPIEKACMLANFAAGVVVGKVGCVPCGVDELKSYIMEA